ASASYLAEYAKVLKKFPVSRMGTPLVPPKAAAQAVVQEEDDDDIGFRLSFEEDDAVKPRVAGGPVLRRDQDTPDNEMPAGIADTPGRPASPGTRPAAETSRGAVPADASPANASPANASPANASPANAPPAKPEGTSSETPSKPSFAAGTAAESARTSAEPARTSAEAEATGKVEPTAKAGTTGAAADAPIDQAQPRVDQAQPR